VRVKIFETPGIKLLREQSRLGDKIAAMAQPIANVIDKVAGTNLMGCGGCKKMRERLNAGMSLQEAAKMRVIEFALKAKAKSK
jgi:hypothetical protein